jgi:hypothetical protein
LDGVNQYMNSIQVRRLMPVLAATLAVVLLVYGCGDSHITPTPVLSVTGVSPNNGASVGAQIVTINGTGFKAGATVTMNRVVTNTLFVHPTAISVTTAAHAVGAVDVVVTNPDGQSASLTGGYTYVFVPPPVPPPAPAFVLTSISPAVGSTEGRFYFEVRGAGFTNVTLTVGGVRWFSGKVSDPTVFLIEAPPGPAGQADVVLTNADGQSSTLKNGFTYLDASLFDFNGEWEGTGWWFDFNLSFTIRNNTLVSASCGGSPNFVSTPVPVTNGHFSMTANGNSFGGVIDAQGIAYASLSGTSFCPRGDEWTALKRK